MAELATLARPYANAVFDLAKQDRALDGWSRMLMTLESATQHERVRTLLESPDLPAQAKAFQLADLCTSELDDRGRKFLQALAEHDRLDLLTEIRAQFEELRADEERLLEVEVVSAYPLTDTQSEALKRALYAKFDKDISIESRVDASLLGGAIIRAGDTVIDGSVRGKLTKLTETLVHT
jgi:F-type H+-transporting ATPase subunit delta